MSAQLARTSVLVLDDEPQVLAAIEDTLENEYRVMLHTSPRVALKVVENEPALSVILTDQRMPEMTGDEFLARARQISDASRLMITGYADLEAVVRAVNDGNIFGYISKPWDPEGLKLTVYKAAEHHRLLRELSQEQRLLHNLMDNIPDAIFFKDLERRFLRLNRAHAARLGVQRPEEAVGKTLRDFFPPEEVRERDADDDEVIRTGRPVADRVRRITARQGGVRWRSTTKAPIKDERGNVTGLVGISRDITERQEAEERVRRLNRVYAVLSGINSLIVRVRGRAELYREACRIAVEAGGFRFAWAGSVDRDAGRLTPVAWQGVEEGFLGVLRPRLSLSEGDPQSRGLAVRAVFAKVAMISNDVENDPSMPLKQESAKRGIRSIAAFPLLISGEVVGTLSLHAAERGFFDDDEMRLLTELAGDISFALEHIEKSERLDYLAYYDELTGLANSTLFHERVEQHVQAAGSANRKLAVFVVNIDRFKSVNDAFGRQTGDELLKQIAGRFARAGNGEASRLARVGADQFAGVVPEIGSEEHLARLAELRFKDCFGPPYRIGGQELRISAKVGIAVFPHDGADAATLFRNAEAALKKAKATGERYLFYAQEMTERVAEKLSLENELRQALEKEEFVLHYQPKIDLETRAVVGVEALIRWQSPGRGLVPPGQFIPLLEETGLILEVGSWALRRASLDHRGWVEHKLKPPRVAVNVSPIQLRQRDFVSTVEQAIIDGVAPTGIDLEITESLVMEDIQENIEKLKAVRGLGVKVAIDDFGTGYSSLGYLAQLPVESLKIDRSFIVRMHDDPNAMTLVSTIISLAHSLRLKVVAEGVETEQQAHFLRLLRCDEMQGYLFSKPLPEDELLKLLRA